MTQYETSEDQYIQDLNPGHTAKVRERLGDDYFSEIDEVDGKFKGRLDFRRILNKEKSNDVGVALSFLSQELLTDLTQAGSDINNLIEYFDRYKDEQIGLKYDRYKKAVQDARSTKAKSEAIKSATLVLFPELNEINEESDTTSTLESGYKALLTSIGQFDMWIQKFDETATKVQEKMKARGLTL